MTRSASPTAFRLSRIYAQGWNAARLPWKAEGSDQTNPYPAEPERGRWQAGFADSQPSKARGPKLYSLIGRD
jgi:hypothetical protein